MTKKPVTPQDKQLARMTKGRLIETVKALQISAMHVDQANFEHGKELGAKIEKLEKDLGMVSRACDMEQAELQTALREIGEQTTEIQNLKERLKGPELHIEQAGLHDMYRESHRALCRILFHPVLLLALYQFEKPEMGDSQKGRIQAFICEIRRLLSLIAERDPDFWFRRAKNQF